MFVYEVDRLGVGTNVLFEQKAVQLKRASVGRK